MNSLDLIYKRKSIRKYLNEDVNSFVIEEVKDMVENKNLIYTDNDIKVNIAEKGSLIQERLRGLLGGYGKVKAPHYLIASSTINKNSLVNIGYSLEYIVLKLTELGIGTCWIGGFFNSNELKRDFSINDRYNPVILIAFGYPREGIDIIRTLIHIRKRREINEFVEGDIGRTWKYIMDAVRSAPSSINSQPWYFKKTYYGFDYFIKPQVNSRYLNLNFIDAGIALSHLKIAATFYSRDIYFEQRDVKDERGLIYITSIIENNGDDEDE